MKLALDYLRNPIIIGIMVRDFFSLPEVKPIDMWRTNTEKKRRKIDKNIRSVVWQKYNQNSLTGKCYACKRPITHDHFEVGHNKARAKSGSDNISNLRPICTSCNRAMGTMSIGQYKAKYFGGRKYIKSSKKKSSKRKSRQDYMSGLEPIKIKPVKWF